MYRKPFISIAFLFIFWIVISGTVNLQHIVVGLLLSSFTVWFWKDFNTRLPSLLSPKEVLMLFVCIAKVVGYVIKSNISVIKILLFSGLSGGSLFIELEPNMKTDWGRVFLATCITITPGTITVDIDPDDNIFTIHALTRKTAVDLYYWSIIDEIKNLETMVQRRKTHGVDNGRLHDSNSISPSSSDNRTERD